MDSHGGKSQRKRCGQQRFKFERRAQRNGKVELCVPPNKGEIVIKEKINKMRFGHGTLLENYCGLSPSEIKVVKVFR